MRHEDLQNEISSKLKGLELDVTTTSGISGDFPAEQLLEIAERCPDAQLCVWATDSRLRRDHTGDWWADGPNRGLHRLASRLSRLERWERNRRKDLRPLRRAKRKIQSLVDYDDWTWGWDPEEGDVPSYEGPKVFGLSKKVISGYATTSCEPAVWAFRAYCSEKLNMTVPHADWVWYNA